MLAFKRTLARRRLVHPQFHADNRSHPASRLQCLFSGRRRQLGSQPNDSQHAEVDATLDELENRLRRHESSHTHVKHLEVSKWIQELRPVTCTKTDQLSTAPADSSEMPGPLLQSTALGVLVGATSPMFILFPCCAGYVPITAFKGIFGLQIALEMSLPLLLNTPIALANLVGAFSFSLCRHAYLSYSGRDMTSANALHPHGLIVGCAAGIATPFLSLLIANVLVAAGFIEPTAILMSIIWNDVPLGYIAGLLVVTVPTGCAGVPLLITRVHPAVWRSKTKLLGLIITLSSAYVVLTMAFGFPMIYGNAVDIRDRLREGYLKGFGKQKSIGEAIAESNSRKPTRANVEEYEKRWETFQTGYWKKVARLENLFEVNNHKEDMSGN